MKRDYQTLGHALQLARLKVGLNQKDVAEHLGYSSPQLISNWERGVCHLPVESIPILCELYKIRTEFVIKLMVQSYSDYIKAHIR